MHAGLKPRTKKLPTGQVATEVRLDLWDWDSHAYHWQWRRVMGQEANTFLVDSRGNHAREWHCGTLHEAAWLAEGWGAGRDSPT